MPLVTNWVQRTNLGPLLEQTELMAGEELDWGVRNVLLDEIEKTDADDSPPTFASHMFDGAAPILAKFGIDQGTSVLHVELDVPVKFEERAKSILSLMQCYRVTR